MFKNVVAFAPMVLSAAVLFSSNAVSAQDTNVPQNKTECMQAVTDTKEARASNPEIGPKAAKVYDEVVELAEKRCEQGEFVYAGELLNLARGMVASE
ncbi:MAG: hypothetical protein JJ900_02050 [Rhodospirillales bacterium]|nr:hypothetical protein [Rhodospirillales bacterium]MBO6785604.1 hypothetical protein [Rhodospirillales bacterium]